MRWHRWIAGIGIAASTVSIGAPQASAGSTPCGPSVTTPVPQPTAAHLAAAGLSRFPFAPDERRVDLVAPPLRARPALDFYAQADDGSVWYFGEDVFNYRRGVIADTAGGTRRRGRAP